MITALPRWLVEVDKNQQKKQVLLNIARPFKNVCFAFRFFVPFLFAEFISVGRVNSPWTANLALCARMAHQSGLVGNSDEFRHPERFSRGKQGGMAFFWLLFFCY
jgi:hypothetical protein